jgi:c-di-GMP-binding flagellar brake protein YcgR
LEENGTEKRRHKRHDVDSIHGRMVYSKDINILNISMDGAAIATTQRLSITREYPLKLKFGNVDMSLKGRVVWSVLSHSMTLQNGEVVPVYKVGIRFTNILSEAASQLIAYIEERRTNPLEKRVLGVRFKVSQAEDAEIDLTCTYTIKKISLGGMLIETDTALEQDSLHEMEISIDHATLSVAVRIANCTQIRRDNTVKYNVGIEFVKVSDEDMKVLQSYIEAIGQKD